MFAHFKLPHKYTLKSIPGAKVTQNLMTDYSSDEVNAIDIIISQTAESTESMTVYSTGLVFYVKATPGESVVRTNGIFKPGDDGDLHLVELDPNSKIELH